MGNYSSVWVGTTYFCLIWLGISGMVRTSTPSDSIGLRTAVQK